MTEAATALKPATIVPEARRVAFLPALFYDFAGDHPEAGEIFKAID